MESNLILSEISALLTELQHDSGDIRWRDGEYISDKIQIISDKVMELRDSIQKLAP